MAAPEVECLSSISDARPINITKRLSRTKVRQEMQAEYVVHERRYL